MNAQITPELLDEVIEVRQSGMANMMSVRDVLEASEAIGHDHLPHFIYELQELRQSERAATWMKVLNEAGEKEFGS